MPPQSWPETKTVKPETPRETILTVLVTAVVRSECLRLDLAYSLAATKKSIQELVRFRVAHPVEDRAIDTDKPKRLPKLLRGWRGQAIGAPVESVLGGHASLQVNQDGDTTILAIKKL